MASMRGDVADVAPAPRPRRWVLELLALGVCAGVGTLASTAMSDPAFRVSGSPAAGSAAAPAGDASSPTLGVLKPVPGGTFTMGSATTDSDHGLDEGAVEVTLTRGFWMMESEVTQAMWEGVMGKNPSSFKKCGPSCPVEIVSLLDAVNFANSVSVREGLTPAYTVSIFSVTWDRSATGYRLPTEAEWEHAARAGGTTVYAGGDDVDVVAWYEGNSVKTPHPVCGKARNAYGLCDMTGNVWEWVWDAYDTSLPGGTDPVGPESGANRVNRGGAWRNDATRVRIVNRRDVPVGFRYGNLGFRLVKPAP